MGDAGQSYDMTEMDTAADPYQEQREGMEAQPEPYRNFPISNTGSKSIGGRRRQVIGRSRSRYGIEANQLYRTQTMFGGGTPYINNEAVRQTLPPTPSAVSSSPSYLPIINEEGQYYYDEQPKAAHNSRVRRRDEEFPTNRPGLRYRTFAQQQPPIPEVAEHMEEEDEEYGTVRADSEYDQDIEEDAKVGKAAAKGKSKKYSAKSRPRTIERKTNRGKKTKDEDDGGSLNYIWNTFDFVCWQTFPLNLVFTRVERALGVRHEKLVMGISCGFICLVVILTVVPMMISLTANFACILYPLYRR